MRPRPPFECIALLIQGGGALGAYQAGVYEALAEANLHPDWIAGISIGAINGALIAGNAPEARVDRLRAFWERVTANPFCDWSERLLLTKGDSVRQWQNQMSAYLTLVGGASGFFTPRFPAPWLHLSGTTEASSAYDANCLKATLEQLVDFDRINTSVMRLSVGAVIGDRDEYASISMSKQRPRGLTAASARIARLVSSAFEFDAQSAKTSTSGWPRTRITQRALDWSKRKVRVRIFTAT